MSLSYKGIYLPPNARTIYIKPEKVSLPRGFSDVYVFAPSPKTIQTLRAAGYTISNAKPKSWNKAVPTQSSTRIALRLR